MEPIFVPKRRQHDVIDPTPRNDEEGDNSGPQGGAAAGQEGEQEESDEDAGWLISTVYDAERGRGTLCIFDAARVSAGPVARLWLPHHLPSGLHGSWSPEFCGPADAVDGGGGSDGGGGASAALRWREPTKIRPL
jgi:hypothetical protein